MLNCLVVKEKKEEGKGYWIPVNYPVAVEFNTWLNLADGLARMMYDLGLHGSEIRNNYGVSEHSTYYAVGSLLMMLEEKGLEYQFYWQKELKAPV